MHAAPMRVMMRLLAFALLLLAPGAGGAAFVTVEAPPPSSCGEGCGSLDPAERVVAIEPSAGRRAAWLVEDERGRPLAAGVAHARELVELPDGAARLRVRAL